MAAEAIQLDIVADRGLPFLRKIARVGTDYTTWTLHAQVRLTADASGSALADITTALTSVGQVILAYGGTDTIANHVSAGRLTNDILAFVNPATGLNYALSDSVALSVFSIYLTQGTMAAMPAAAEQGNDVILAWDMLGDDGAGPEFLQKIFYGKFTVRGTVTQ